MKQRSVKRMLIRGMILVVLVSAFSAQTAAANSAQSYWEGTTSTGIIVTDEACPIVVENEQLTFDVLDFPNGKREDESRPPQDGKVTAAYTFYNPADYSVKATLVFPFGVIPDYGYQRDPETDEMIYHTDADQYVLTVNDKPIDKKLRHTLSLPGYQFALERDMALLHDGYMEDAFFHPDLPVTRYTFMPKDIDTNAYSAACAAFMYRGDASKTMLWLEGQNGGTVLKKGVQLQQRVASDEEIILNVIGEPLAQMPDWKFYENGMCEKEIGGSMTVFKTETLTFKDLALDRYQQDSGILEYDWYNAFVEMMKQSAWKEYGVIADLPGEADTLRNLMCWYEYEIELKPGERIVNTVTAPMYPSFNINYNPPLYEYEYLLSPAQTWAAFGTLDIAVNTSYLMQESSIEGFKPVDAGYIKHFDGLPEGELTFTLCSEEDISSNNGRFMQLIYAGGICVVILVVVLYIKSTLHKR